MSTLPKFVEYDRKVRRFRSSPANAVPRPAARTIARASARDADGTPRASPSHLPRARVPRSPGSSVPDRRLSLERADSPPVSPPLLRSIVPPRQVLRWNAYFKESVTESAAENHRVRKCVIYMYLEDESIYVGEPRQPNSGIPRESFLKRHRIRGDDSGASFGVGDVNVGSIVTFYGRAFRVVSCDAFTRSTSVRSGTSRRRMSRCRMSPSRRTARRCGRTSS